MSARAARFVYGPVPSRRLGRSLGVDLVPYKTCSYDCTYCQLGRTTNRTTELREYAPVGAVLDELRRRLPSGPTPDFIGLAGSGEPTLHAGIGELVAGIKGMTTIPVAVLTNGSMLWASDVRAGLAEADLVMPSLDAGDQRVFERVNRPHPDIQFDRVVDGLITFADGFRGAIWLEVFVLGGITDRPDHMERIVSIAERIHPARVQLNTVSRPPAEGNAHAASAEALERLRGLFPGFCEIIAGGRPIEPTDAAAGRNTAGEILALLGRRPCTVEGISAGLGMRASEVVKHLDALCTISAVRSERRGDAVFYEEVRTA